MESRYIPAIRAIPNSVGSRCKASAVGLVERAYDLGRAAPFPYVYVKQARVAHREEFGTWTKVQAPYVAAFFECCDLRRNGPGPVGSYTSNASVQKTPLG